MYYCMNFSNRPVDSDGCIINIKIDNHYGYQLNIFNSNAIYFRRLLNNKFDSWNKIL